MDGKCQCCGVREGGRWLEGRGGQELNTGTGQLQCPCVSFLRGTNNIHWTMTLRINKCGYIIVPAVPTKLSMSAYTREQVSVSQVSSIRGVKVWAPLSFTAVFSDAKVMPSMFKFCTPQSCGFFHVPMNVKVSKTFWLGCQVKEFWTLHVWLSEQERWSGRKSDRSRGTT